MTMFTYSGYAVRARGAWTELTEIGLYLYAPREWIHKVKLTEDENGDHCVFQTVDGEKIVYFGKKNKPMENRSTFRYWGTRDGLTVTYISVRVDIIEEEKRP